MRTALSLVLLLALTPIVTIADDGSIDWLIAEVEVAGTLIFATAGEFVRAIAEGEGLPPYEPYWMRGGFEEYQGWAPVVPIVNAEWIPVVRGDRTPQEAYNQFIMR